MVTINYNPQKVADAFKPLPTYEMEKCYKWLGLKKGKVLDLCCGPGRNQDFLIKKGLDIYGMDISDEYLQEAKKYLESQGHEPRLVRADMKNLPFKKGTFDSVYSNAPHAEETKGKWRGIYRALKKGGRAYIALVSGVEHLVPGQEENDFDFSKKEIRKWFWAGCRNHEVRIKKLEPETTDWGYGALLAKVSVVKIKKLKGKKH